MDRELIRLSRFLSLVLRHKPETIDLELDANGWANVDELLSALAANGRSATLAQLHEVVSTNDKQRFKFDETSTRICANQGHSIPIDLQLSAADPPNELFHGTADRNLESIRAMGLRRGSRQHVHLSLDRETASTVGARHGRPIVLRIRAQEMAADGWEFFLSANGVWLSEHVPADYIDFP